MNRNPTEPPTTGVLLVNLGTPEAPTPAALRRYLARFLSDPRVVDLPRWLWRPVLHGVILRLRPRRAARAYRKVWTEAGSPLLAMGRRQEAGLRDALEQRVPGAAAVALGMRYGEPAMATALETLRRRGLERLLVLPLYPQYSGATTGSTFDELARVLRGWRRVPELRMVADYHDFPPYIEALARSVREVWDRDGEAGRLLFSFHGVPQRWIRAGDPYLEQCRTTARLVAQRLGLEEERWALAFQSRFGREAWLEPATDATLRAWAREGVRRADVICPGFAADCLETLEEIALQARETFLAAGGEAFRYIPALNDAPDHLAALAALVERHACGWPGFPAQPPGPLAGC